MRRLDGLYVGQIVEVIAPDNSKNKHKHQYEYECIITGDDYSQMPLRCIRNDAFGTRDDYYDAILAKGDKVFVMFPRGDRSLGVIFGGNRFAKVPQDPDLGRYWLRRFNEIEAYIDQDGDYSVTSDSGPHLHVRTTDIELNDSEGQEILLDKETKTLTLRGGEWIVEITENAKVTIAKNANITISGDAQITVEKNAAIAVTEKASLTAKSCEATIAETLTASCKELSVKASGNAAVKAGGNVTVDAAQIVLNGQSGDVLTTVTSPLVDSIFGIPTIGVPTVKSG